MSKSFVKTIQPGRPRSRTIEWPFPVEGGEAPKVTVRVLGADEIEEAHFQTADYYKRKKLVVKRDDPAFVLRENAALVFRAFSVGEKGTEPIAESPEELMTEPAEIRDRLIAELRSVTADVAPSSYTSADLLDLVEELKKNTRAVRLQGCSSTTLIELVHILVSQLDASTPDREPGL